MFARVRFSAWVLFFRKWYGVRSKERQHKTYFSVGSKFMFSIKLKSSQQFPRLKKKMFESLPISHRWNSSLCEKFILVRKIIDNVKITFIFYSIQQKVLLDRRGMEIESKKMTNSTILERGKTMICRQAHI